MSVKLQNNTNAPTNPLDNVEDIFLHYDWTYDRSNDDELVVHVGGEKSQYTMIFIWQEDYNALQFSCLCDSLIPQDKYTEACQTLQKINESIWLGHFEISGAPMTPRFRYTMMLGQDDQSSMSEKFCGLMDIALAECERHYDIFSMINSSIEINENVIALALSQNPGKA